MATEAGLCSSGREPGTSRRQADNSSKKPGPIKLGAGLLVVPGVLVGRIRRGEYVDFAELPSALPDGSMSGVQSSKQLLIVQAAVYRRTRRRVPDVTVWIRCFILFVGTVATEEPERLMDLLGYRDAIVRSSPGQHAWSMTGGSSRWWQVMTPGHGRGWTQGCILNASRRRH